MECMNKGVVLSLHLQETSETRFKNKLAFFDTLPLGQTHLGMASVVGLDVSGKC